MANGTCSHATPIRIIDSPLSLTAGSMTTPAPLGAAVLSLAEGKRTPLLTGLPGYRPILMRLTWADMGVPVLTRDDWDWLAQRLTSLPTKRLHVHCQAGHGRTGTALAILCSLWGAVPEGQCPVTWVRTLYCPSAVETQTQLDYVARITGRTVTAAPSVPAYSPSGGGAWTGQSQGHGIKRDLWEDPYAKSDYFGSGVDTPPRDYRPEDRYRAGGDTPRRARGTRFDDSVGARRERFQRYLPTDLPKPDRPATETTTTPRADRPGESPTVRITARYPTFDGPAQGGDGTATEAPPEQGAK